MAGFRVDFDESATDIVAVKRGIPFEIARRAAIEEIRVGVLGDIDEGDVGGRVADNPDVVADCEAQAEMLEKQTETGAGGRETVLDESGRQVLAALLAEAEQVSFYELIEGHEDFLRDAQVFLEGDRGKVSLEDLLGYARDYEMSAFLAAMGHDPAPAALP